MNFTRISELLVHSLKHSTSLINKIFIFELAVKMPGDFHDFVGWLYSIYFNPVEIFKLKNSSFLKKQFCDSCSVVSFYIKQSHTSGA